MNPLDHLKFDSRILPLCDIHYLIKVVDISVPSFLAVHENQLFGAIHIETQLASEKLSQSPQNGGIVNVRLKRVETIGFPGK
jgi:hypothetical protein